TASGRGLAGSEGSAPLLMPVVVHRTNIEGVSGQDGFEVESLAYAHSLGADDTLDMQDGVCQKAFAVVYHIVEVLGGGDHLARRLHTVFELVVVHARVGTAANALQQVMRRRGNENPHARRKARVQPFGADDVDLGNDDVRLWRDILVDIVRHAVRGVGIVHVVPERVVGVGFHEPVGAGKLHELLYTDEIVLHPIN